MSLWPLAAHFGLALLVAVLMIAGSRYLGERQRSRATGERFEGGVPVGELGGGPLSPQFFLVAVFFVIFDIEVVFLFAWAVAAPELGWAGYVEAAIFVAVLLVALGWLWRIGALDFRARRRRAPSPERPAAAPLAAEADAEVAP
jgi:NADH-quinone oxidoreductase subunit A